MWIVWIVFYQIILIRLTFCITLLNKYCRSKDNTKMLGHTVLVKQIPCISTGFICINPTIPGIIPTTYKESCPPGFIYVEWKKTCYRKEQKHCTVVCRLLLCVQEVLSNFHDIHTFYKWVRLLRHTGRRMLIASWYIHQKVTQKQVRM